MYNNPQWSSWPIFVHSIQTKSPPSQFDGPQGSLFKLTQTSSVHDNQCQFEALYNRVIVLPHNFLLSYFILGLKPHIRHEVQALQSLNLMHAIDLAKLQEDKFSEIHKFQRNTYATPTYPSFQTPSLPSAMLYQPFVPNPLTIFHLRNSHPLTFKEGVKKTFVILVMKKLFQVINAKVNFSLLFNKRKLKMTLPRLQIWSYQQVTTMFLPWTRVSKSATPHISKHTLADNATTETLQINGTIKNKENVILIDGGSTHNFIQNRVVKFLGLQISKASKFYVMVGNGDKLLCNSSYANVPIKLGNSNS